MNVAIIPARGGSKRIPGKNIKDFHGKPIIQYSIDAAIESNLFCRVIVSTDSDEVKEVAEKSGAEVPFKRPSELSDDNTPTAPVVLHALSWLNGKDVFPQRICCIYPTAPFITSRDLSKALKIIETNGTSSVFPVTTYDFSIFRSLKVEDGTLKMFWPENELKRSQDLPEAYHDAGLFYWLDAVKFKELKKMYTPDTKPLVVSRLKTQDIDTPEDWVVAEVVYEVCKKKGFI